MNTTRVIGLGNLFAGDDAAGILVVRKLQALHIPGVDIIEAGIAGLSLLDLLDGATKIVLVDAVHSGQEEGIIVRLEIPRDQDLLTQFSWDSGMSSTHSMGLGEVLVLGAALGTLPTHLSIMGIELAHCTTHKPMSRKVLAATEKVVTSIVEELKALTCTNSI